MSLLTVSSWMTQAGSIKDKCLSQVIYKGRSIGEYRLDLLVEDLVVVEIKSVERFDPVFEAQLLTYLRVTGKKVGLLVNFNSKLLKDGIKRFVL
jgi:GxxExxY protein